MVVKGKGSYTYWGRSDIFKDGDPSSDEHQPFNPMKSFECDLLTYDQEIIHLYNKLDPQILFDNQIEEYALTVRTLYRDPMLLLSMFPHKEMPTAWTGTADTIFADFSDVDDRDNNIWVQHHGESGGANDIDLLFDGGELTNYKWTLEPGAIIEEATLMFVECTENTQAVDIDDGFDDGSFDGTGLDGGWSLWDGAYTHSKVALTKDCTITYSHSSGLSIQSAELEIETPKARYWAYNSLSPAGSYDSARPPIRATLSGILLDNSDISEALLAYPSKTPASFKIQYGTTKYLQVQKMYLKNISGVGILDGGKASEATYELVGTDSSAGSPGQYLTFSWTANETDDPEDMIKHSNV